MNLYIKPWCPWCIEAVEWMKMRGIEFRCVDVVSDGRAFEHMRKISRQSLTPTLELPDGAVLADFDTRQLATFLEGRKP